MEEAQAGRERHVVKLTPVGKTLKRDKMRRETGGTAVRGLA